MTESETGGQTSDIVGREKMAIVRVQLAAVTRCSSKNAAVFEPTSDFSAGKFPGGPLRAVSSRCAAVVGNLAWPHQESLVKLPTGFRLVQSLRAVSSP